MPASFAPRLDILPEGQRLLWPELDHVPQDFVLYGGTALALQLGHRVSEDFDFFSAQPFDPAMLQARLPFFRGHSTDPKVWIHRKPDNLEGFVERAGPVKIAFFGGLSNLRRVRDPLSAHGSRVQVASLLDLAGMKMRVIQRRGSWKDYVDLHALALNGIDVVTGLSAARAIDPGFDPAVSVRALQYYGDGTLDRVPAEMQKDLSRWAQAVDLTKLPIFEARAGLTREEQI